MEQQNILTAFMHLIRFVMVGMRFTCGVCLFVSVYTVCIYLFVYVYTVCICLFVYVYTVLC